MNNSYENQKNVKNKKQKFNNNGLKPNEPKIKFKPIPIQKIKDSGIYHYCEKTGIFTKTLKNGSEKPIGCVNPDGYRLISIFGVQYLSHRVAYAWLYGDPEQWFVDHISSSRDNNMPENLRLLTRSHNVLNSKLKEGQEHCNIKKYNGKRKTSWRFSLVYLGERYYASFDTLEEALEYRDTTFRCLNLDALKFYTNQSLQKESA